MSDDYYLVSRLYLLITTTIASVWHDPNEELTKGTNIAHSDLRTRCRYASGVCMDVVSVPIADACCGRTLWCDEAAIKVHARTTSCSS
jgi:hypothetical protein